MLDWVIVGGGIHGVHHALMLRAQGTPADRIAVVDPHAEPLARWEANTHNTGMSFLRSPLVHHLDADPYSLRRFADTPEGRSVARFIAPYDRPALALFRAHTTQVVHRAGVRQSWRQGRVTGLRAAPGHWQVETSEGMLEARRVLLALGLSEQPHWPAWAVEAQRKGWAVHHLFDPAFDRAALPPWGRLVVVGGGITAAQAALALAARQPGTVALVRRHPLRVHDFDSDSGWMGPKYMTAFQRERDPAKRRRLIAGARHRGSVPGDVARDLRMAVREGALAVYEAAVEGVQQTPAGAFLRLATGERLASDVLLLATGFDAQRPGGAWLADVIAQHGLRCAACGYPLVNEGLCWHPGLYVTGPLAELEIGPVARNVLGARLAARRLAAL